MITFKQYLNERKKGWHLVHDEDFEMEDGSYTSSYWIFNGTSEVGRLEDAREYDGSIDLRSYSRGNPLEYVDLTRMAGKLSAEKVFAKFIKTAKGKKWTQANTFESVYVQRNIPIVEAVSRGELASVEKFADKLFANFDIDVEFTKHFADRVNDRRNKPGITAIELKQFFKKAFIAHANTISNMGNNKQAVLNDLQKELNLPFVYKWDGRNFEFDLVAKTIMRKSNFRTPDKKLRF